MGVTHLAEPNAGPSAQWMLAQAKAKNALVMGSIITEDGGRYYNRLYIAMPTGELHHYNKRHLFTLAEEDKFFSAGKGKQIVEYKGWKISPMVCYDLRFPIWSRNIKNHAGYEYDVLVYVANWPEKRSHAWKSLLPARAIENQAYVVGTNRIGTDVNDIYCSGDSAVYDFKGEALFTAEPGVECIQTAELNRHDLVAFRRTYAFLSDADKFSIEV
jgi:predicted amidohydrolase